MRPIVWLSLLLVVGPATRHRAVRPVPAPCTAPTLLLTLSKTAACPGEGITLSWQASDPRATVAIIGIGNVLPASGSQTIYPTAPVVYSGRAANACGAGSDALAEVKLQAAPAGSLSAGSYSLQTGQTTTLFLDMQNASSWTLSSTLGNGISPSFGTTGRAATYTATRSGVDTVTLTASGACGSAQHSIAITVSSPTTTPPPSTGYLRCCDGTFSPTCTSCANKQGCCSNHKGVCGC